MRAPDHAARIAGIAALVCVGALMTWSGISAHDSATRTAAPTSSSSPAITATGEPSTQPVTAATTDFASIVDRSWSLMLANGMTQTIDSPDADHLFAMSPALDNAPQMNADGTYPAGYLASTVGGPVVKAAHEDPATGKTSTVSSMEDFILTFAKKGLATGTSSYRDNGDGTWTETSVDSGSLTFVVNGGLISGFVGTSQTGGTIITTVTYGLDAHGRAVVASTVK